MAWRFGGWLVCLLMFFVGRQAACAQEVRPNILWLSCEDISPHLGCYGFDLATTPHLDGLAAEGIRFRHAYATAGVCAPCRSAIITGMYQTSIGTHHMRCDAVLPSHVKPFTHWLREAGYYCTNNSKQDYQFQTPKGTWDASSNAAHWKNRPGPDHPFFAVFNFVGCHESGIAGDAKYRSVTRGLTPHDRDRVAADLPPYYPDTPRVREDWGRYYDVITAMDLWVGEHLRELDEAGLRENTIVIFWSDHGVGLPRAKRWLYDSGLRVPLIVRIPERFRGGADEAPGIVSERLVSLIDLGPTTLHLAGVPVPAHMHGRPFLGAGAPPPREYIYGARDRMDERYDIIRAVRDQRFKYIRNYEPFKTFYQYMNTPEQGATMHEIRRVERDGTASPGVAQFLEPRKAIEELYDTDADPDEMHNLAGDPRYADELRRLRDVHLEWVLSTRDLGLLPEAEIAAREARAGSAWGILNGEEHAATLIARLRDASSLSLQGPDAIPAMRAALKDDDAGVRYWAAVGLGNLGPAASSAREILREVLADESENVRVAAARALCRMHDPAPALPVLTEILGSGSQWARLHAANVLDEIGEQARPAIDAMREHKVERKGEVADGKYTVRVLNRALNELLGTDEEVP